MSKVKETRFSCSMYTEVFPGGEIPKSGWATYKGDLYFNGGRKGTIITIEHYSGFVMIGALHTEA